MEGGGAGEANYVSAGEESDPKSLAHPEGTGRMRTTTPRRVSQHESELMSPPEMPVARGLCSVGGPRDPAVDH